MEEQEKESQRLQLKAIEKVAASLSHELRTPLASIRAGVSILEDYFPTLYEAYDLAKKNNLAVELIYPDQFKRLEKVLQGMGDELRQVSVNLDALLANTRSVEAKQIQSYVPCSMSRCIEEALERYFFASGQRELIVWKSELDFNFIGSPEATIVVLHNLIRNALYSIMAARKGSIEVWAEPHADYYSLYFQDTGLGMNQEIAAHLFDLFYSKTHHGQGLGLSYSKSVMKSYGGDILCDSVEGEYSRFELRFPSESL